MTATTDCIVATTVVEVDAGTAFEVFTDQVDAWWRHGPRFRTGARGESVLRFEPRVGGRLLEIFDERAEPFVLGRITVWTPAERLVFEMMGRDFRADEKTEVTVCFGAAAAGTRVTIEHRGWDAFAPDHPVRHGLGEGAFTSVMGVFWADLLVSLRGLAESDPRSAEEKRGA